LENEINEILNNLGLDDEEIHSVNKRNKLLKETTSEEVSDIVDFFSIRCKIEKEDIARLIIKNPLILNESFSRINLLSEIYDKLEFSEEEYKKYIVNFDKAFSLNPKEVIENISNMLNSGKTIEEIKKSFIEESNRIF